MKKIVLFLGIAACIFTACQDRNAYTLTGRFADNRQDGKTVYLQKLDSNFRVSDADDSTKVENGIFSFKGIAENVPVVQFIFINDSIESAAFVVEKGKIEMNFDSVLNVTLKGTVMNNQYKEFKAKRDSMFEKMGSARMKYEEIKEAGNLTLEQFQEFKTTSKKQWEELGNIVFNYIKPDIKNPAGQYFLIDNQYCMKDDQLKELISLSTSDFQNSERIQKMKERIEKREATAVGKYFTDVKGLNFNGKEVSLSDYAGKGKVALVDFWASWCGPCIYYMPDVVKIYQQYKNKGFEIVGISLDINKDNWKKSTDDLKITWPQFSNLKGWDEDCAVAYGINSIPQTILIDKDGKIIERGLDADALRFELEKLLGNK